MNTTTTIAKPFDIATDRLIRRSDIFTMLQISRAALTRLIKDGKFPGPTHRLGRTENMDRWPESMVKQWASAQEVPA